MLDRQTFWPKTHARNARLLVDAAEYFRVLRDALLSARHSIWIIGWDIHSRMRFFGANDPVDGWPGELGDFLKTLARARPDLSINVLVWKSAFLYAGEREWFPAMQFEGPDNLVFCLDDSLPLGSAQHQKFVVIDDALAFVGGLDLTIRRWDDHAHAVRSGDRIDPSGQPYPPFHDVQLMVDGDTALRLGELARIRFDRAGRKRAVRLAERTALWPADLKPQFSDATIWIERTEPAVAGHCKIDEIKHSILASIASAERFIYIENQFVSAVEIARRIRDRMLQCPQLEVLIIAPKQHSSWIESRTMRNGRIEFMGIFEGPLSERIRLLNPVVTDGDTTETVMVHSKLMIIDDRLLRVGSANLNNRSMGTDTECDLVLVGDSEGQRRAIAGVRNALIAHYCGVTSDAVEACCAGGSMLAAASLSGDGHRLEAIDDGTPDPKLVIETVMPLADPPKPLVPGAISPRKSRQLLIFVGALVILALLGLAWSFTPLKEVATPEALTGFLSGWSGWRAVLVVIAVFVVGGLVVFPVILLVVITAATLDPATGLVAAVGGILASAALVFAIGRQFEENTVRRVVGDRFQGVREKLLGNGVLAIAFIRMIPIAPFSLVNFAAGALRIGFAEFMVGTLLGMAPGLAAVFALGATASRMLQHPTPLNVAFLVLAVAFWLLASVSAQYAIRKIGRPRR
jgi:phospholipase D1/2